MSEPVYVARKRTCPFCSAPVWLALARGGVVVCGTNPEKGTAYQHTCEPKTAAPKGATR